MSFIIVVSLVLVVLAPPVAADPTPSLDELMIAPQGSQVTLTWDFYYKLLPSKFIFREQNSQPVTLDDPPTLKQNLTFIAANAFDLTVDGQPAPLTKIAELTLARDGGCIVRLLYPGRKNGRLQVREPLLSYYPPSYIMDYRVYAPLKRARNPTGYLMGGNSAQVIEYVEPDRNAPPFILDNLDTTPIRLFKAQLRVPWTNTNWLILALLLVLNRPARELAFSGLIMAAAWIVPCFFWTMDNLQVGFSIHPIVPGLVTAALCALCLRRSLKFAILAIALAAAGLLNGCFDIQQTSLERPEADVANLVGESLGFVTSLGLIFTIDYFLVAECRKFPGFDGEWKPKICWALAILALILSFVR